MEINSATRVQTLDEAIYISNNSNIVCSQLLILQLRVKSRENWGF